MITRKSLINDIHNEIINLKLTYTIRVNDFFIGYWYNASKRSVTFKFKHHKTWDLSPIGSPRTLCIAEIKQMLTLWLETYEDDICDFYFSEKLKELLNG